MSRHREGLGDVEVVTEIGKDPNMRRTLLALTTLALALTPSVGVDADGHTDGDRPAPTDRTDRPAPTDRTDRPSDRTDIEVLRLECAVRADAARAAVGCHWSAPTSPRAEAVRVWRLDPATDHARQIVFRTDDLGVTSFVDEHVRRGHEYAYSVQALSGDGAVVGQSRAEWVKVPRLDDHDVEVLRLHCELGAAAEAIGCEWSRPHSRDAYVVTLWRSVDGGAREVVERFRPEGPNQYRDPVPPGASKVTYAVIATSETDRIVARSRAETVRIPSPHLFRREVALL